MHALTHIADTCRGDLCKIFGLHSEFEGKTKIIDKFQIWHNTLYSEKGGINKILKMPYIFRKFQLKQFFLYFNTCYNFVNVKR